MYINAEHSPQHTAGFQKLNVFFQPSAGSCWFPFISVPYENHVARLETRKRSAWLLVLQLGNRDVQPVLYIHLDRTQSDNQTPDKNKSRYDINTAALPMSPKFQVSASCYQFLQLTKPDFLLVGVHGAVPLLTSKAQF